MFLEGHAERVSEIADGSIKLMYGSPPYPLIKRNYGYWTEERWLSDMQSWMTALRPKMRGDGFIVINAKAGRIKGVCSTRSLVVEDFARWMTCKLDMRLVDVEIWSKKNPVPTGLRCAAQDAYEQNLIFAMSNPWSLNLDAIRRPYSDKSLERYRGTYKPMSNGLGYNSSKEKRDANPLGALPINVVEVATKSDTTNHQAAQREELPSRYILACTDIGDLVWDMWLGTGTTARAAIRLGRLAGGTDVDMSHFSL